MSDRARRLSDHKPLFEDKSPILRDLLMGFERSQLFLTAIELGIFDLLTKPSTAEFVIGSLGTHEDLTRRFLDILVALGLLVKEGERYATEPTLVPFVTKDGAHTMDHYCHHAREGRDDWLRLALILKAGPLMKPEHKHEFDPELTRWIGRWAMLGRLQATLRIVSDLPEFQNARKLLDVGGGHGLFAIGFAQENPNLEAYVFDQPNVTPITQEAIRKYGMGNRVKTISGDFTKDSIGSGYDMAFQALSYYKSPEETVKVYRKIRDALNDGGLFLIQRHLLDNDGTGPTWTLIWDFKWRIARGRGFALTEEELSEILADAGFSFERSFDLAEHVGMPIKLIVSRKKS